MALGAMEQLRNVSLDRSLGSEMCQNTQGFVSVKIFLNFILGSQTGHCLCREEHFGQGCLEATVPRCQVGSESIDDLGQTSHSAQE